MSRAVPLAPSSWQVLPWDVAPHGSSFPPAILDAQDLEVAVARKLTWAWTGVG